ncbi:MAG: hypothetical protein WBP72_13375 [Rhodocyclaceae bacterium]
MFPLDLTAADTMTAAEIVATTRAMIRVARVHGITAAEIDLIRAFYGTSAQAEGGPSFEDLLESSGPETPIGAGGFGSVANRETVVALCYLTAYADGELSAGEREVAKAVAAELAIGPQKQEEILAGIKDQLLAQLSHLPDAGSVAKVARELG